MVGGLDGVEKGEADGEDEDGADEEGGEEAGEEVGGGGVEVVGKFRKVDG